MSIIGTLPNTIANGDPVDATPVMADFNWIVSQVNGNAAPLASPTFTGQALFAAGSAATPSVAIGEAGTGFYKGAGHAIDATLNGTQVLDLNATSMDLKAGLNMTVPGTLGVIGLVSVGGSSPASGAAGVAGVITWDASFIYVCTASGAWKRAALTGGY